MSQQDPLNSAAQRREVVIATLAAAVHRWHRERIRAGVRASRAASIAPAEFLTGPRKRAGFAWRPGWFPRLVSQAGFRRWGGSAIPA